MTDATLPPAPHVDRIVNAASQAGVTNASLWWDYGWRPATFPIAPPGDDREMMVAWCPGATAPHERHSILVAFARTPLGARDDEGGMIAYRVAPCQRCRALWYEARQLRGAGHG